MFLRIEVTQEMRDIEDFGPTRMHVVMINGQTVRSSLSAPTRDQVDELGRLWEEEARPKKLAER